jgi:hypothetical protein
VRYWKALIEQISRSAVLLETDWRLATRERGPTMCEKCVEIDDKIEHYQRMASRMTDQAMRDGNKDLIEQMKAQKVALHPERAK